MCLRRAKPLHNTISLPCVRHKTKHWLSLSAKQRRNPCSGPSPECQDLSLHRDWPLRKATVNLPIKVKGIRNSLPAIR